MKRKKDPISEARRYVDNAKETLKEKGELNVETRRYEDEKYVRAAGSYLWLGVLMALDAVFHVRSDRRKRVDINEYRDAVGRRDRKLLDYVNDGYDVVSHTTTCDIDAVFIGEGSHEQRCFVDGASVFETGRVKVECNGRTDGISGKCRICATNQKLVTISVCLNSLLFIGCIE